MTGLFDIFTGDHTITGIPGFIWMEVLQKYSLRWFPVWRGNFILQPKFCQRVTTSFPMLKNCWNSPSNKVKVFQRDQSLLGPGWRECTGCHLGPEQRAARPAWHHRCSPSSNPCKEQHPHKDLCWDSVLGGTDIQHQYKHKIWVNIALPPARADTSGSRRKTSQGSCMGSWLVQNPVGVCFLTELLLVAVLLVKPFKHAKLVAEMGLQKYWSEHFEMKLKDAFWKSGGYGTALL